MERAVAWLLSEPRLDNLPYRPKLLLSAGFAGGLTVKLKAGDLVLATEVAEPNGAVHTTTWPGELPPGEWRPPLYRGRLLSGSELLTSPEQKRTASVNHAAQAVDTESAPLARLAGKMGIPWGCLRGISDDAATPLSPELANLLVGGRVSYPRLALLLLRNPGIYRELRQLARTTDQTAQHLATALGELLTLTLAWANE